MDWSAGIHRGEKSRYFKTRKGLRSKVHCHFSLLSNKKEGIKEPVCCVRPTQTAGDIVCVTRVLLKHPRRLVV